MLIESFKLVGSLVGCGDWGVVSIDVALLLIAVYESSLEFVRLCTSSSWMIAGLAIVELAPFSGK